MLTLWAGAVWLFLRPIRAEAQRQVAEVERPCVHVRTIHEERALRRAACRHLGPSEVERIERLVGQ